MGGRQRDAATPSVVAIIVSGPKHSSWEVARNARLVEQRRQAAIAEAAALKVKFDEILSSLETVAPDAAARLRTDGQRLAPSNGSDSVEQLQSLGGQLSRLIALVRQELDNVSVKQRLYEELDAIGERARAATRDNAAKTTAEMEERRKLVDRLLGRAASIAPGDQSALSALAARILTCPKGQVDLLERELRLGIQAARARAGIRIAQAEEVAALKRRLHGLDGAAVERVRAELEEVANSNFAVPQALRAAVAETERRARRAADREYAAHVLREEFVALGYDVGEDFVTAFHSGGAVQIARSDKEDYAVDIRFNPHGQTLDTELVRTAAGSALSANERSLRDKRAETEWCSDMAAACGRAEQRAVRIRVKSRVAPGVSAVRSAAPVKASLERRRSAANKQAARLSND